MFDQVEENRENTDKKMVTHAPYVNILQQALEWLSLLNVDNENLDAS